MFKITDVQAATGLVIAGYLRENSDNGQVAITAESRAMVLSEVLVAIHNEVDDWADNLPAEHVLRSQRRPGLKPHEHAAEMFGLEGDDAIGTFIRALAAENGSTVNEVADAARKVATAALAMLCATLRNPEAEFPAAAASVVTDAAAAGFEIARGRFTPGGAAAASIAGDVAGGIYRGLAAGADAPSERPIRTIHQLLAECRRAIENPHPAPPRMTIAGAETLTELRDDLESILKLLGGITPGK